MSRRFYDDPCAITAWGFFVARPGGYEGSLEEDMAKDISERIRKAQDKAMEHLDYIMETVDVPDFVEIVGRVGGDVVTYRVYDDGSLYGK